MKVGAEKEKKKIVFLVVLTAAAAYLLYTNVFSAAPGSDSSGSTHASVARPANSPAGSQKATPAPATPSRPEGGIAAHHAGVSSGVEA